MSTSDNKGVVRGFIEDVLNGRNLAALSRYVGDNVSDHLSGTTPLYAMLTGFPDFHLDVNLLMSSGDTVGVLTTFTGSHQAPIFGMAPSGNGISSRAAFCFRVVDGKIVEIWSEFEPWGLLPQVGIDPFMYAPDPRFSEHRDDQETEMAGACPREM